MKILKKLTAALLIAAFAFAPAAAFAADDKKEEKKEEKLKPYKLENCLISDEKLGEMGEPVAFGYKGQEVKICCKSCKKDFDKEPAKFMKKLAKLEKEAKKKEKSK